MLEYLKAALGKKVKVFVVTRLIEDFQGRDVTALQRCLGLLKNTGVRVVFRFHIHQKFAVIDQRIVW